MKKNLLALFIITYLCGLSPLWAGDTWQRVYSRQMPSGTVPANQSQFLLFTANERSLKAQLAGAAKGEEARTVELPMADGSFRTFRVWSSALLPEALAAKYPGLSTYTGVATDDASVTVKLDFTEYGFHAMVFDGHDVSFIDPANDLHDGYYTVHYKSNELREDVHRMRCMVEGEQVNIAHNTSAAQKTTGFTRVINGYDLRKYRLALSCNHQYAQTATALSNPTKAQVLSKMTTTMNRVNGVYERELSVTMVFVPNEDTLIFTQEAGDPFSAHNDDPGALLGDNQLICDSFIGNANYDIGHIFSTGAGGLSQLGVVCGGNLKAQSVTGSATPTGDGFDIDYVAHEMGHEFGSQHTFNNSIDKACANNAVEYCAYEPGSGSTIMCYAGICSPDNLQSHSDAYFSGSSLEQIQHYITTGGDGCAVKTPTNNKLVNLPSFTAQYYIPYQTPFELTAPDVTDSVGDTLITYCWEQWNLGEFGYSLPNTHIAGPIFRSFPPVKSPTRMFPNRNMVLSGTLSNAGTDNASGEKAPDVARLLTFRLTMRDIYQGNGCFLLSEDSVQLNVINTGQGFTVTSQNIAGQVFPGNTTQTITWNVAKTTDAPVSTPNVDIYMSADSGKTWTYHIGTFPNNGSATINVPNPDTTIPAARFKVKGAGNVFFNVNSKYFRVERNFESAIKIYPVPAHSNLHIELENSATLDVAVYDAIGRCAWSGQITGSADLPSYLWGRGIYFVKLVDSQKRKVVRKIVIE